MSHSAMPHFPTSPLSLIAALLPISTLAAVATNAPALAEEPGTIVVTGRGLEESPAIPSYGSQVLDRDRLNSTGSGLVEDALGSVASFQQFRRSDSRSSNPSAQGVTLRALGGNATSRTLVLLDGVPMADPFFGYIPFNAIAPERLASARITRGGGTGAFGSGAVAGTIELTSGRAGGSGLGEIGGVLNQRGERELSASAAPRLGSGFAVLSARSDRGQGFWTTPRNQRVPASVRAGYDNWSIQLQAAVPTGPESEIQARIMAFDDERTLRFRGADTRSRGQDASLRFVNRGSWQVEALGYVQVRDFSNVVISATSFRRTLDQRKTPSTGLGGKIEIRPPIGEDRVLRLGADLRLSSGRIAEEAYSGLTGKVTTLRRAGGRNGDLGLFAESDWTLGSLLLTGGLRADRWTVGRGFFEEATPAGLVMTRTAFANRSGWALSVRGGWLWHATPSLDLRASAYTGLRQPTLNELYRPFVVFPVTTRANAGLHNERLRGFEGGADWRPLPGLNLSLTAFDNRLRHAVANVTIAPNLRQRMNVDAIAARGLEADVRWQTPRYELSGSLARTHARVRASGLAEGLDGMRPAQTAAWSASARIAWRPKDDWALSLSARHTGAQYEDDLETDVLPAATTLDAYAEVPLGRSFQLILRGENLTGERVVTRNQGGSIDLGAPRTVWAGFRIALP